MDSQVAAGDPSNIAASRKGSHASDNVRVFCLHCNTTNRLPRARLDQGAKCGSCKQPLLPGHPFELTKANFDHQLAVSDLPLVVDFWLRGAGRAG